MYSFIACFLLLVGSYFVYGKFIERKVGIDENKQTPVWRLEDGVDYMPMSRLKGFLVQFLNIAGLGPIFGVIQGALFGPSAFLWITFGTIFIGAVHDFFSGFLSLRNDGLTMPGIISKYLGTTVQKFVAIVTIVTGVMVAAVFSTGSAALIGNLTGTPVFYWTLIIFVYFLIATLFPVDKIIGKVYPVFGVLFIIMVVLMIGSLILNPNYTIPEFTTQGLYLTDKNIFPYLFVTIACGAISGFHASQSPIVARCMKNENDARPVFFGAMVLEGLTALCWAAIALAFFHVQPQLAATYAATPTVAVHEMATALLNPIFVALIIIGIVVCPISTGDTALRSSRITIADELHINQEKITSRLKIALPLFIAGFALTFVDFTLVWRYVAWAQLLIGAAVLLSATAYLMKKEKPYIITLAPAIICILITFGYILQAPEGFRLPAMIANVISVILTIITTAVFLKKYKNNE
ncbi:carbon starvation protein A [Methanobrevibacter sp.]|uniref:carbon starvation CstA family protein n=1 Tax=Methanobrevibacter sp. TaxID=66852 RepID=UPI0025E69E61|nr:carbon starvation CstA family protein [Methanobrevibacter sp.]MBQ2831214.1 carbon starvation protein A [Methanobrevibacter sp.]